MICTGHHRLFCVCVRERHRLSQSMDPIKVRLDLDLDVDAHCNKCDTLTGPTLGSQLGLSK